MPRIFISYRQADSEGHVGRLYDHLKRVFDESEIFRDLDSLHGGEEFSSTCEKAVEACEVFIAVIGPNWLNIRDDKGRRLDNPKDVVRREIATALKQKKRVIPVLVARAAIPKSKDLPDEIATLVGHDAIEISPERFSYDVDRLIQAIGGAYGKVTVFGPTDRSSQLMAKARIGPRETFQVWIDRKPYGEFESDNSITLRVEAGVHTISVRSRRYEWEKFVGTGRVESNELRFELKGGQAIFFSIERTPDKYAGTTVVQKGAFVIKPYQPLIKP